MTSTDRDDHGRFANGNSGGPGRPRRSIERDYLRSLADVVASETWKKIVARAVEDAINGDHKSRIWLGRHVLPVPNAQERPLQKIVADECAGLDPLESEIFSSKNLLEIIRAFK